MSQQLNTQVFTYAKQFIDNAFKAQSVALSSLEKVVSLQVRALESQSQSAADFISDAFETRDADGLRSLWEKGAAVARENSERAVALTQEIAAISQKTAESLGALVQEQQQAANDAVAAPVAAAKKAAGVK
ncbi:MULTISPECIES: phasin family protein [Dyella]|uniref:Phasin family protein n=2 Tax=Dyella TaxID=231454 RepID=A0A4R0YTG0_9GAMM|nr:MULTISPECIES: phasin family protein [Dyella]TBR36531.1 phasin family protein [Dyella terrae]TCI08377.1 phasin family protein [Dyella soli]